MNKKHFCESCYYATDKLSHFKDHLKSAKHAKNLANFNVTPIDSRRLPA